PPPPVRRSTAPPPRLTRRPGRRSPWPPGRGGLDAGRTWSSSHGQAEIGARTRVPRTAAYVTAGAPYRRGWTRPVRSFAYSVARVNSLLGDLTKESLRGLVRPEHRAPAGRHPIDHRRSTRGDIVLMVTEITRQGYR